MKQAEKLNDDFGIEVDAEVKQKLRNYAEEAAVSWTTGRCVHIMIEEKNKTNKRKRVQEALQQLDSVGFDESKLHKVLSDQIKRARLEGV